MAEREIPLSPQIRAVAERYGQRSVTALAAALRAGLPGVPVRAVLRQLTIALLPAVIWFGGMGLIYRMATQPAAQVDVSGLVEMGGALAPSVGEPGDAVADEPKAAGISEPPAEPEAAGIKEPPAEGIQEPPAAKAEASAPPVPAPTAGQPDRQPAPLAFWLTFAAGTLALLVFYWLLDFPRLEIFRMLLTSFFPLYVMIMAVLGSIAFGLATPTEAAAVGSLGGFVLAAAYRQLNMTVVKESVFLAAKTSAMVCWLFVGSSIFSAAFALLGGQAIVENWVLSLNMTPLQFMILAQFIIFILGWPLEWTEIIIIFMPIFLPMLPHFGIDPMVFGILVAVNLQTAFLSPPMAMSCFYLKGVAPKHVLLSQIFSGCMPFVYIVLITMALMYMFPQITLWLPGVLYSS
jgi:TRAP-type mannitol/chloroaromatic compound transport system permease large subunit